MRSNGVKREQKGSSGVMWKKGQVGLRGVNQVCSSGQNGERFGMLVGKRMGKRLIERLGER